MEGKQVSIKQFVAIQFLVALAVKMFMLPALMLRIVGKDSYIVMGIWIAFEFISLTFFLITAKRNPDKTIYDILSETLGKVVSRIVVVLFSSFFVLKAILIISEIKMFFSVTMYAEIGWAIMIIPLLVLLASFAIRSLRAMGRTAEIILPIVLISTLVLTGLLIGDMQGDNLMPVLENGFAPVAEGLITFPVWFGDITFLLIFLGNVKLGKGFVLATMISKLFASLLVMFFSTMLFATYANMGTLIDYGNNVSNMTQFSLGAHDYGRFDLLFYCVWMLSVFMKLALIFYFLTRNVSFVINSRHNYVIAVSCAVALYVISEFFLENENTVFLVCTGVMKYIVCPPAFIMPGLLLLLSVIKYKPNYHTPKLLNGKEIKEKKNGFKNSEKQNQTA